VIQHHNAAAPFTCFYRAHQARGAGAKNQDFGGWQVLAIASSRRTNIQQAAIVYSHFSGKIPSDNVALKQEEKIAILFRSAFQAIESLGKPAPRAVAKG
jgi:hypothetical protein